MKFAWGLPIFLGIILNISFACKKANVEVMPFVFGHAGTALSVERAVFPPNTDQSIWYGLDVLNADGVEVDVQMTKDSVLVLYHNDFLEDFTTVSGCINDYNYIELKDVNYYKKYKLLLLSDVVKWCLDRNKRIIIDIKQYNFCAEAYINFETLNNALNKIFKLYSVDQKSHITVNSRNIQLLAAVQDENVLRTLEPNSFEEGIEAVQLYNFDRLLFKLTGFSTEKATVLSNLGIRYGLFGVKTKQDIALLKNFSAAEIITDNIAATKKYYN